MSDPMLDAEASSGATWTQGDTDVLLLAVVIACAVAGWSLWHLWSERVRRWLAARTELRAQLAEARSREQVRRALADEPHR